MHFVTSLAWEVLGQHILRCILFLAYLDAFLFIAAFQDVLRYFSEGYGQHKMNYILCTDRHEMGLVNTCWGTFCVFAGIEWVWWTQVEIRIVSSLALEGFGQHMFTLHVEISQRTVFSTHVELHYASSLAIDGFCQDLLRFILCPRWHMRGLLFACWTQVQIHFMSSLKYKAHGQRGLRYICVIFRIEGVSSTHVTDFLRCILCHRRHRMCLVKYMLRCI